MYPSHPPGAQGQALIPSGTSQGLGDAKKTFSKRVSERVRSVKDRRNQLLHGPDSVKEADW